MKKSIFEITKGHLLKYNGKEASPRITEDVTAIDYSVFENQHTIKEIYIPDSVKKIGVFAFAYCTNLKVITLPLCLEEVSPDAFRGCKSLGVIEISELNEVYRTDDGVLYSHDGEILILYPEGKRDAEFKIPCSVKSISDSAFMGNEHIKSIIFSDGIRRVGKSSFFGCKNLKSVKLPDSLEYIDFEAFSECPKLTSINIPEKLQFVGKNSFDKNHIKKFILYDKGDNFENSGFIIWKDFDDDTLISDRIKVVDSETGKVRKTPHIKSDALKKYIKPHPSKKNFKVIKKTVSSIDNLPNVRNEKIPKHFKQPTKHRNKKTEQIQTRTAEQNIEEV